MRIAVAGVHIESSTFSPHLSTAADFEVTRGHELMARYPWWREADADLVDGVEWIPILHARALPGGVVEQAAYDTWRSEIVSGLVAAGELDGVLLDLHGAMTAQGYDDVEGDLATAVRSVVGSDALISVAMDLHGNVSEELFGVCDLLTCYRTAPHRMSTCGRPGNVPRETWCPVCDLGSAPRRLWLTSPFCSRGR